MTHNDFNLFNDFINPIIHFMDVYEIKVNQATNTSLSNRLRNINQKQQEDMEMGEIEEKTHLHNYS